MKRPRVMFWLSLWRLRSRNSYVRRKAVNALGELRSRWAVKPLVAALKDKDVGVRVAAAQALGAIGDVRAVDPLVAELGLWDGLGTDARDALVQIGSAAVEPLVALIQDHDQDEHRQRYAAHALGRIGDPRAVEPLLTALQSSTSRVVRADAADALGEIGDRRAVDPLIASLRDRDDYVRTMSANALTRIGWQPASPDQRAWFAVATKKWDEAISLGSAAVEPLTVPLRERHGDEEQLNAAVALGKIGDPRAIKPLAAALKDKNVFWGHVRMAVVEALTVLRAVESLVGTLDDPDFQLRRAAASALAAIGWRASDGSQRARFAVATEDWDKAVEEGAAAVESLMIAFTGSSGHWRNEWTSREASRTAESIRRAAANALVRIGPAAVEPLASAFEKASYRDGEDAAYALKALGWLPSEAILRARYAVTTENWDDAVREGPAAVKPLIAALKRHDPIPNWPDRDTAIAKNDARRNAAAGALAQIGVPAVEPLLAALKDTVGYGQSAWHVPAAADALVRIGPAAVGPLVGALIRENVDVRIEAEVLSRIGDPIAVRPLVAALRERSRNWDVGKGISVLQAVLEKNSGAIQEDDLRALVDLTNRVSGISSTWMNVAGSHCESATYSLVKETDTVDCSLIKQLSRQELIRRGLKA